MSGGDFHRTQENVFNGFYGVLNKRVSISFEIKVPTAKQYEISVAIKSYISQ